MTSLLAWTPFLQPAPGAQHWWWLLVIPMALGVSMAYKAIRVQKLGDWPKAVVTMAAQIVAAMIAIAIGLYLLVIVLLPVLPAGSVVVLDNARFHQSPTTAQLVAAAGCELMFLPPYSPDLNPIEHLWAALKARLRPGLPAAHDPALFISQTCLCYC